MTTAYSRAMVLVGRYASALALWFTLSLALAITSARAEDYPNRPVKIIVPFAAGGTADAIPRSLSRLS